MTDKIYYISMDHHKPPAIPHSAFVGTFALVIAFSLVFLYLFSLRYHLQFFYPWSDIPMHIMGGMLIGLVSHFIGYRRSRENEHQDPLPYMLAIMLSALVIGIMWELYEVIFGLTYTLHYWPDTVGDILMDLLGAGIVALIVRAYLVRNIKKSTEIKKKDDVTNENISLKNMR